jgi:hypothetical protein
MVLHNYQATKIPLPLLPSPLYFSQILPKNNAKSRFFAPIPEDQFIQNASQNSSRSTPCGSDPCCTKTQKRPKTCFKMPFPSLTSFHYSLFPIFIFGSFGKTIPRNPKLPGLPTCLSLPAIAL